MVNKNKTKLGIKLMKQNNLNFKNIIMNKKLQKELRRKSFLLK